MVKDECSTKEMLGSLRCLSAGRAKEIRDIKIAQIEKQENKKRSVSDTSQEERLAKSRKTGSFSERHSPKPARSESPQASTGAYLGV